MIRRSSDQAKQGIIVLKDGEMKDIKDFNDFRTIEPVNKGWSTDRKFYIETKDDRKLLLRVAEISEYDRRKAEYDMLQQVADLNIPMSQPVDFGICDGGKSVYTLLTWCEGEDAQAVLPLLTETEQYMLGKAAGEYLKYIHSIPAPEDQEEWGSRFNRKVSNKISQYIACCFKTEGEDQLIGYIEENRHLLYGRPQCYQHGDYHVGNMIISAEHKLSIIDFNRSDYGDPWEEFNRIVFSVSLSPHFATGQLNGYFGGRPPLEFFKLLALYISINALSSIILGYSLWRA